MVGWHHQLDEHEFEQAREVGDGQGGLECISTVQFSRSVMFDSLQPHGLLHTGFAVLHYLPDFAQTHVH